MPESMVMSEVDPINEKIVPFDDFEKGRYRISVYVNETEYEILKRILQKYHRSIGLSDLVRIAIRRMFSNQDEIPPPQSRRFFTYLNCSGIINIKKHNQ